MFIIGSLFIAVAHYYVMDKFINLMQYLIHDYE